jgi:hypothetical protein
MTTFLQVLLLAIAIANVVIVSNSIENKQGLSSVNKVVSWTVSSNKLLCYKLLFLKITFYNVEIFFSFINVFNQKNLKSIIK